MRRIVIGIAAAAALLVTVSVGSAHVTPTIETAPAGSTQAIGFTVGHGCEGSPTKSVSIAVPAGVISAKPQPKPGWKLSLKKGKLPEPGTLFGEKITNGVLSVTWSGGLLQDDYYDQFFLRVNIPNKVGKTIYFPVVQRCVKGVHRWIQIPQEGKPEPESPAPGVKITKASGGHG
jgi:periplasmic copper chaperone A